MQSILRVFIVLSLTSSAFAGDVLVDLDEVRESRQVESVDGVSSAGQPDAAALAVFAESGYKTVIDLRMAGEDRGIDEPAVVESLGMEYVSLPIGRGSISFESARQLDALIEASDGPVLLHCGSGNRVGALLALRASLNGASDEEAIDAGKDAGLTRLEDTVQKVLSEQ